MQILRIILMVCFVFTAYTPIGEAVDIEAVDISKGSKKKSSSRAELPLGVEDVGAFENKENQGGSPITLKGNEVIERDGSFEYQDSGSVSGRFDNKKEDGATEGINSEELKRLLQLQKESLATPTEDDGDDGY